MKVAIISDIHGNMEALQKVYDDAKAQGVKEFYCLGDSVDYGARSQEVVAFLQKHNIPTIMGNHDKALFDKEVLEWFNDEAVESNKYTKKTLTKEAKDWLKRLPLTLEAHGALLVHGCPPDSFEVYMFDLNTKTLAETFTTFTQQLCFVGHTHLLATYVYDGTSAKELPLKRSITLQKTKRYIINVGSVGQPRDDDNRAKYVIYDTTKQRIIVRKVKYNIKKVQERIREAGLPEENATILQ